VNLTADQLIGAARLKVRAQAPYFASLLLALVPTSVPGLGTIGVSKDGLLLIDEEWIVQFDPKQVAGLLVHELMHLMHKCHERCGQRDPKLWNMADDLAINPSIIEMGFELPQGENAGLFPKNFGFAENLMSDEYYELLLKEQKKNPKGKTGEEGHVGAGGCSSCSGNPHPKEPKDGSPMKADARSEADLKRAMRATAESIRDHASKGRGTVPGSLQRWADLEMKPPKIPWRQKLQVIVRHAVAYRAGAVVTRYDAPSRRQAALGFGNGAPILPRPRMPTPNIACGIDTSGSMGPQEIAEAVFEVAGILKAVGAEVDFVACDSEVSGLGKLTKIDQVKKLIVGGGGTNFVPVFEAFEKMKNRPEVAIFCTDGGGPAPDKAPIGMKVIWLLVGAHRCRPWGSNGKPIQWGEFLDIDDKGE
jgi:predicted metal-dependent peptidase